LGVFDNGYDELTSSAPASTSKDSHHKWEIATSSNSVTANAATILAAAGYWVQMSSNSVRSIHTKEWNTFFSFGLEGSATDMAKNVFA
jgi:hypothetical protein